MPSAMSGSLASTAASVSRDAASPSHRAPRLSSAAPTPIRPNIGSSNAVRIEALGTAGGLEAHGPGVRHGDADIGHPGAAVVPPQTGHELTRAARAEELPLHPADLEVGVDLLGPSDPQPNVRPDLGLAELKAFEVVQGVDRQEERGRIRVLGFRVEARAAAARSVRWELRFGD
jgi:hypothetical protein